MADRAAGRNGLRRRDDGIGVDAVVPIELGERSGLAEMLDAQRARRGGRQRRQARRESPDGRQAR